MKKKYKDNMLNIAIIFVNITETKIDKIFCYKIDKIY